MRGIPTGVPRVLMGQPALRHRSDDTHIMHVKSPLVKQKRWDPGRCRSPRKFHDILLELAEQPEAVAPPLLPENSDLTAAPGRPSSATNRYCATWGSQASPPNPTLSALQVPRCSASRRLARVRPCCASSTIAPGRTRNPSDFLRRGSGRLTSAAGHPRRGSLAPGRVAFSDSLRPA